MNKQINKSCFVLKSLFWFCGVLKEAFFKAVFFYVLRNFSEYRTSPNKRSRFLCDFEVLRCHAYWKAALKKGCAYFKVRQIVHMKFQNFSSQQIVVLKTYRGRSAPTCAGLPLKILFEHPGDVPISPKTFWRRPEMF